MKKKILLFAAIVCGSFASIAQDQNDGKVFTPEAGDWALGFDAAPALNFVGNMFNGSATNSLSTDFVGSDNIIFGKYYKDATTAYRMSLRIMNFSSKSTMMQDTNGILLPAPTYIENTSKSSGSALVIGGGLEKRKGDGRFQGYYGGELLLSLGSNGANVTNTYGATLDTTNLMAGIVSNNRVLSSKAGSMFGVSVRGFIGVEYFVLPKISLGAELGWGIGYYAYGSGEEVTENWGYESYTAANAGTETLYESTSITDKSTSFGVDTDNVGGRIKLLFHF